jgi:formate hydrogenlyase transcriptional activator
VLRESGGVVTAAATKLGLHRTTLNAMMRKLGISRKDL